MKFPNSVNTLASLLVHVFTLPIFLLLSVLLYEMRPLSNLLHAGDGVSSISNIFPFNIAIVFTIVLGSMLVCRLLLFFIRRRIHLTIPYYSLWCVVETFIAACFAALFLTLISHGQENYFTFMGRCFMVFSSIFVYPYVIIYQAYNVVDMRLNAGVEEDTRIKFYDNRKLLKFTTTSASVLYIQASENYIDIYYVEDGKIRKYELRNSMKSIEQMCSKAGFVRVHRSYLVNPQNVKSVAKAEEGRFFATLNAPGAEEVPVSKKYYENIVSLL